MVVQRLVGAERCARALAESRAAAAEGALAAHGLPVPSDAAGAAARHRRCLALEAVHRITACISIITIHISVHVVRDFRFVAQHAARKRKYNSWMRRLP